MHRGEALRMINERLSKTPLQISCQTIGAVSALTVFDVIRSVSFESRDQG